MSKIDVNELRKLFSENVEKRKKADFASAVAKQKQKQAVKKAIPPTKQERMEAEVKRLETQDKLNKLTGRGKPETGAEAVDRLLEALKKQNQLMYNTDGSPVFSGRTEISPRGTTGSNFRIALERMEELEKDLKIAQKAKKQGNTFQEQKRIQAVEDKYRQFYDQFNINTRPDPNNPVKIPERIVDGNPVGSKEIGELPEETKRKLEKRRRELARYTTNKFFSK